jgi:hypothetical protein
LLTAIGLLINGVFDFSFKSFYYKNSHIDPQPLGEYDCETIKEGFLDPNMYVRGCLMNLTEMHTIDLTGHILRTF